MAFGKFRDKPVTDVIPTVGAVSAANVDPVIKPMSPLSKAGPANTATAFIGSAASIVGTLKFDSSAEIGAYVEGEIHSTGRLTILETGVIKGSITAVDLIIKGKVHGNIKASNSLALCKPACITGDISSPSLSMESGVVFDGRCSMPEVKKTEEVITPEAPKPLINNAVSNN